MYNLAYPEKLSFRMNDEEEKQLLPAVASQCWVEDVEHFVIVPNCVGCEPYRMGSSP